MDSNDVEQSVILSIQRLFPNIEQDALQNAIGRIRSSSTTIGVAAAVGGIWIGASFWGAMDTAFCRIYHVECRSWVHQKRFSLVMLLGLVLLLAASVAVPTVESAALAGADDLPWGLDELGAIRTAIVVIGGFLITFGIVSSIYWAVPKGHAVALGLARRPVLRGGGLDRELRVPAVPDDGVRPGPHRGDPRVRPDRAAVVLRGQPGAARRRGDQLALRHERDDTGQLPIEGKSRPMSPESGQTDAAAVEQIEVRILPDPEKSPVGNAGPLRSIQEAELVMPGPAFEELWTPATLERLARRTGST